ncbi:glucosamine-6-phosphate deaminase [Galbibacter pacificus]|uniref:Glucosamine-6-phosphate deaminase n=1 Tax=Galbibacter pacificus TaxID=2996052 RepID=A0ABT6FVS4_9FLAO|nr:glucosamine-6-phosphate deaminase [Galbibacter pacificus]MDG3583901.1 glucosamine-6-phosphate deaminase [Galbibacter pacificus]MDG3587181.1 glucosamine-6-phosphate deaminase [Galbibacter pacificus]
MKVHIDAQNTIKYEKAGTHEHNRYEKIHNVVFEKSSKASYLVAKEIADLIREKNKKGETCVLGLATGSSPIRVYDELVKMHKNEGLSFKNVVTFNLDEYYPMNAESIHSYHYFMNEHLFNHIDIPKDQINIPNGTIDQDEIASYCKAYEEKIAKYGGLDFQLLGIGRTGHIGFNEPGSHYNSITRSITLDQLTREDAAPSFLGIENVPKKAITMGVGTVFSAKRIVLLAWGHKKASVLKETIEGEISPQIPATYLQEHNNTTFVLDTEAASLLTRFESPWLVGEVTWTDAMTKRAVVWLCDKVEKSILRLTDKDYNEHGLASLITEKGSSYELNIEMFNKLQHTITGWPGGKPNADDTNRPERKSPEKKRVIIFSPHPDDDVISMGGTFDRLVEQGHEVHIAYQTSGNIAVSNADALKYAEVAMDFLPEGEELEKIKEVVTGINKKKENETDAISVRELKGLIRKRESIAATRYFNVPDTQVHFLNLPFYETGTVKKHPLGPDDIQIVRDLIASVKPHQVYAAGDLADPHGTHKVCLDAVFKAMAELKSEPFMNDCWLWLYRGAWHEWEIHEIDMAVPMSPDQVLRKRKAIFFHQTQKDGVLFQGEDLREFWVRAEDRNKKTAQHYRDLGLADYAAIEAFKRFDY